MRSRAVNFGSGKLLFQNGENTTRSNIFFPKHLYKQLPCRSPVTTKKTEDPPCEASSKTDEPTALTEPVATPVRNKRPLDENQQLVEEGNAKRPHVSATNDNPNEDASKNPEGPGNDQAVAVQPQADGSQLEPTPDNGDASRKATNKFIDCVHEQFC